MKQFAFILLIMGGLVMEASAQEKSGAERLRNANEQLASAQRKTRAEKTIKAEVAGKERKGKKEEGSGGKKGEAGSSRK